MFNLFQEGIVLKNSLRSNAELVEDLNIDLLEDASGGVPQPPENLSSYGGACFTLFAICQDQSFIWEDFLLKL